MGDDKQVSPTLIGIPINKIELLNSKHLSGQPYGPLMRPGFSLYDLALAAFAGQKIMLREHFRCVEPIIRFSFQFYDEEIIPLRVAKRSERLDPPLIDVHLKYGHKERNKTNPAEANYIVTEIASLVRDPAYEFRSIGVVSLLGQHQAALINKKLLKEIGEDTFLRHQIICGDAAAFQGKERDIMFISMVAAPNDCRKVTAKPFQQRFNVALSRAKDRMYLVRSLDITDLEPDDLKARVLEHFRSPFGTVVEDEGDPINRCESNFEKEVYTRLTAGGYRVRPQFAVGNYRIDLVVESESDQRLAIELDGEKWHGPDRWWSDYKRQMALERMGWTFWRCWGSDWRLNSAECLADLRSVLDAMQIRPSAGAPTKSRFTEYRSLDTAPAFQDDDQPELPLCVAVGDAVELEITDAETPSRVTYTISATKDQPADGVIQVDSVLAQTLLRCAIGDDVDLNDGKTAIVVGIFKERADKEKTAPSARIYQFETQAP